MLENELNVLPIIVIIDSRIGSVEFLLLLLLLLHVPGLPMLLEPLLKLFLADQLAVVIPYLGARSLLVHIQVYIINLHQHFIWLAPTLRPCWIACDGGCEE